MDHVGLVSVGGRGGGVLLVGDGRRPVDDVVVGEGLRLLASLAATEEANPPAQHPTGSAP
ncbi:hypothetical protein L1856_34245 [Streptomyces sp. Tue 6430]|nr:hypothetical protein [Streptomyces sp. Tue 6430]